MTKMTRTQIHLGEWEKQLLELERLTTGASKSELIRRAIRESYGGEQSAARRRPRSIGIVSSGRIPAAEAKQWVRREWDREYPTPGASAS